MPAPSYTADDFAQMAQALLPRGHVWPRDISSMQYLVLLALAQTYQRTAQRASELLVDAFPASTEELLPDWEDSLGLPDPCAGPDVGVADRLAHVLARFTDSGGENPSDIIAYAASLGFTITITEFLPAVIEIARIGDPLDGSDWAHTWAVNAPLVSLTYARVGISVIGDPLTAFGNAVLECELKRKGPAHTIVQFRYS